ncbi:DNA damage-induced cell division inhibitor SosA [Staphylococcus sp. Marseille-Q5304]|uniref:DNA damage-induced cell division inhibitor SosA n=1 Tax=Staphylococcus sp. Marseille-Q5304 TaxID=2942200 RepID=UPI002072BCE2|nr:DNA damage-induced cell division inhibitor SosA [Staphylococcus sp. Marseille-Q5304]
MFSIYKEEIMNYLIVMIVTMVIFSIFILNAYHNANTEHPYELEDHQVSKQDSLQHQLSIDEKKETEHDHHSMMLAVN